MTLDLSALGASTDEYRHAFTWRDLALYALGIGATRAEGALLYEGHPRGMQVVPTYAVVPAYPAIIELLGRVGAPVEALVHSGQQVQVHGPVPPEGTMVTTGRLEAVHDLKRFARLLLRTHTLLDGAPLFDTEWTIVVRDAGGFGGPRPPRPPRGPALPRDQSPAWTFEQASTPEQALLYRLNGDTNPLHADDEVARAAGFEDGAILHGLCTMGFVARAVIRQVAAGDAQRLRSLTVSFHRPVWPGDVIQICGTALEKGRLGLQAVVAERGEAAVLSGWAELGQGTSG